MPQDLEVTFKMRPRSKSGVIFSVYNGGRTAAEGDYIVLQLVNGEVLLHCVQRRGIVVVVLLEK